MTSRDHASNRYEHDRHGRWRRKSKADLPFDKWYDPGLTSTYTYSSPVFTPPASATQFTLTSVTGPASPITVVGPQTIIGNYAASTYSINYMSPLDPTTDGSIINTGKNGRVIPVKVDLFKDGVTQSHDRRG